MKNWLQTKIQISKSAVCVVESWVWKSLKAIFRRKKTKIYKKNNDFTHFLKKKIAYLI